MRTLLNFLAFLGPIACCAAAPAAAMASDTPFRRLAEPALPAEAFNYSPPLPAHLQSLSGIDSTPSDNPVTNAGATLGRVLFHDRSLSRNGLVSCASCHTQAVGFDDPTRFSIGFEGRITARASMPLVNVRFNPGGRQFRDARAENLEAQVLLPFTDPIEMGLAPGELATRVSDHAHYRPLFRAAFGDETVSEERIAQALAQFVRSIVSYRSRYDRERSLVPSADLPFPGFTESENRGKALFLARRENGGAGCASCHETEAFVMLHPRNNGLDAATGVDDGVGAITGRAHEMGLFRAPSLRNVAVTAPYMHDGRLASLEAVLDHYSGGVAAHPNLSPELRRDDGSPANLQLSPADREALVDFLETLTDTELLADPRFSDPFLAR
jgi:cytochrome c peroxidase